MTGRQGAALAALCVLVMSALSVQALAAGTKKQGQRAPIELDYRVSLAGFPIAVANLRGTLNSSSYRVALSGHMTGVAHWFSSSHGEGVSEGVASPARVLPATYRVEFGGSKGPQVVKVALSGGNVTSASIEPPLDPRPDRVPLEETHKRGVLDPLSAMFILNPGTGPILDPAACNRTLPIFDGAGRYDITLSYAATKPLKIEGYQGDALVCSARYTAIAGHRLNRAGVRFMEQNRELETWLIPVPGTRALVPARFHISTMVGSLVIEARRFGANTGEEAGAGGR